MRKRALSVFTLLGFLFLGISVFAAPLDNWHWRNPLPNANPQDGPHTLNAVIFTNGYFYAVGASGVVSISSDATNWTENSTATSNNLNGLVYGNGEFLAVGESGAVETSINGTSWVLRASGTTNSLTSVAYANGKYVAVGGSVVITSPDAVNWSSTVSGLSGATGLAGGSAGFVAVGGTGSDYYGTSNEVFFSADGSTWTSQILTVPDTGNPSFNGPVQNSIVTYFNGAYFIGSFQIAGSMSYDDYIFKSIDGSHWTTNVLGNVISGTQGFYYNFFMVGNGYVIAAGEANAVPFLQFSTDGVNWATTNNLPDSINNQGNSGAYGNGNYVIVANAYPVEGLPLPPIYISSDGLTWTNVQHPPPAPIGPTGNFSGIAFTNDIYVVATSNSVARSTNGLVYSTVSNSPAITSVVTYGGGFVGVGSSGIIYVSGDGLSWTQRNSGTLNNLHCIASGGGLLVAVGDNGAIQTSTAGTIWTSRTSGTSLGLYGVACSNGLFVTVGQLGTVLTSLDGISWTGQDSGQLTNLLSVAYGSAGFAAVGSGGTILTSLDGANWTQQQSGILTTIENISFGNGYYLAVGDGAVALTSRDGITWISHNIGASGGQSFLGSSFLNNRFDIVGSGGTILESDTISPLFDLQIHFGANWITAFAPLGSNFRIQFCTNLATSNWVDTASFDNASPITQWTNTTSGNNQIFYRAVSP